MNVLTRKLFLLEVNFLAERKWEGEVSWNQIWAPKQWNPESKVWESVRGREWMRVECVSSTPTPRPLFKDQMAGHLGDALSTTASSHCRKLAGYNGQVESADPWGRPTHLWACWLTTRAQVLPNGYVFWSLGAGFKLAPEDVQKCFSKCSKACTNINLVVNIQIRIKWSFHVAANTVNI